MYEKYLPIGTIVKLKESNKNIMIIGYYSLEYSDSIIIYDYVGCTFPEGLLVKNNLISFNHEEIISVEFIGYKDDIYENLNKKLNEQLTDIEELETNIDLKNETSIDTNVSVMETNNLSVYEQHTNENDENLEDEDKALFDINEIDMQKAANTEAEYPFAFNEDQNKTKLNENVINNVLTSASSNQSYILDKESFLITDEDEILAIKKNEESPEEFPMPHYEFDENGIIINN